MPTTVYFLLRILSFPVRSEQDKVRRKGRIQLTLEQLGVRGNHLHTVISLHITFDSPQV